MRGDFANLKSFQQFDGMKETNSGRLLDFKYSLFTIWCYLLIFFNILKTHSCHKLLNERSISVKIVSITYH